MALETDVSLNYPRNLTFTELVLQRVKQFAGRKALVSELATKLAICFQS